MYLMWSKLPKLVRFLIVHALIGMALGVGVTAFIIWKNIFGLGDLFGQSRLGMIVFGVQMALTLGAVQIGVAVLSMDKDDD